MAWRGRRRTTTVSHDRGSVGRGGHCMRVLPCWAIVHAASFRFSIPAETGLPDGRDQRLQVAVLNFLIGDCYAGLFCHWHDWAAAPVRFQLRSTNPRWSGRLLGYLVALLRCRRQRPPVGSSASLTRMYTTCDVDPSLADGALWTTSGRSTNTIIDQIARFVRHLTRDHAAAGSRSYTITASAASMNDRRIQQQQHSTARHRLRAEPSTRSAAGSEH